jgi:Cys-rich four helix bundle protein (predicted Tat secretion target)
MRENEEFVSRRNILKGFGLFAAAASSGLSLNALAESTEHSHAHHMHTVDLALQRVIDHAMDCIKKGETCAQHCIELFKIGDTSVANCADSVQEMLASCTAMSKLAAYNSKHLKAMMKVCISVCEDCEKECNKHADKHAECKACADSCKDCIKVCKDYLA